MDIFKSTFIFTLVQLLTNTVVVDYFAQCVRFNFTLNLLGKQVSLTAA